MRILIATVTAGAGHLQAAAALEEAWRHAHPNDELKRVDLLDYVPKLQKKVYVEGYVKLIEHAPELWGMIFKTTDNPKLVRQITRLRRAFAKHTNRRFFKYVKTFGPDIVLCTHYLPVEIMGHLRSERTPRPAFTVCVVTDFEAHALWMDQAVDLYCVAADETKASLVARGVDPAHAEVTGIPIAAKFAGHPNARAVRRHYGLRDDLPVLLVLGGGFGMGPVAQILSALDSVSQTLQILVVTGRNEALRRELASQTFKNPANILGFVANMHELMAVADLAITKPGGLTSSEAMAMGCPMFILNPIPGQESANSDFLLERGAAVKINRVEDLPHRVEQLIKSPKLKEMARAAKGLGRPHAARDICAEVLRRAAHTSRRA
jgi:processive 1,2-diacylglycerol beta-glucosyltransferase